ncbi:MAG: cytochrome c [Caldilineaceae bacterium]
MKFVNLMRRSLWRTLILSILPVAFFMILAACQSEQPTPAPTATPEPAQPTATTAPAATTAVTSTQSTSTTSAVTATTAATSTNAVTSTSAVTSSSPATSTAPMTGTSTMTATSAPTSTSAVTNTGATTSTASGNPEAGAYIVAITGGCGCHLNRDLGGLAGGNAFTVTGGIVYAPNLTPDKETGMGEWTPDQIAAALIKGVDDEGKQLHPVMPYKAFSALSQQEALDVAAYLLSLKPLSNKVGERNLKQDPPAFTPAQASPATAPTEPVARGQELVTIAQCGGCHTPKNQDGSPMADMMLAGAPLRGSEVAANITPDETNGIGKWTEDQIAEFMRSGKLPDGKQVEGAMAQQIQRRFSKLTEADAKAIAAFLKSIPAVKHDPSAK